MLDKNHIEEYKNIKAPEELKEKVMSLSESNIVPLEAKKRSVIKKIAAAAACAAIIFAGSYALYNDSGRIEVSSNGAELGASPVAAVSAEESPYVMRASMVDTVKLDVDITKDTTVLVDEGEVRIITESNEPSVYGTGFSVSVDFSAEWQIPPNVDYAEILFKNDKKTVCIAAERNVNDGLIYLTVK